MRQDLWTAGEDETLRKLALAGFSFGRNFETNRPCQIRSMDSRREAADRDRERSKRNAKIETAHDDVQNWLERWVRENDRPKDARSDSGTAR
jgi:hypothetical protein